MSASPITHRPSPDAIASARAAHERHFVRRARERFSLRISPERYREFCRRVVEVEDGVKFLHRDPKAPARTQWGVRFGGYPMRVVFDETTERLVTCMPFSDEKRFDFAHDRRAKLIRVRTKRKKILNLRRARSVAIEP